MMDLAPDSRLGWSTWDNGDCTTPKAHTLLPTPSHLLPPWSSYLWGILWMAEVEI